MAPSARETYEQTPIGAIGVFAHNGHDKDELESLQREFELLEMLEADNKIEINERVIENWTGKRFTTLLSFRRLA